jgi:hypothetical protein
MRSKSLIALGATVAVVVSMALPAMAGGSSRVTITESFVSTCTNGGTAVYAWKGFKSAATYRLFVTDNTTGATVADVSGLASAKGTVTVTFDIVSGNAYDAMGRLAQPLGVILGSIADSGSQIAPSCT